MSDGSDHFVTKAYIIIEQSIDNSVVVQKGLSTGDTILLTGMDSVFENDKIFIFKLLV